jgi:uncharacterized membrane protein YcaP (DUF421 family)
MGRKQISQLTFFDYTVGITIGSIAAMAAVDRSIPVLDGIMSIFIWTILTILISEISLKNIYLRLLIDSEPLLIIDKGKVIYKNMKKARYNIGDLLMQLRNKDIFKLTDVEAAILEPDGKLSVLKKTGLEAVTAKDLNINSSKSGITLELILNGKILNKHLDKISKDKTWLLNQINLKGIKNIKDIVFLGIQADGEIYFVLK